MSIGLHPHIVFKNKKELEVRLQELKAEPKRSLGQNFLISERAVSRIILTTCMLARELESAGTAAAGQVPALVPAAATSDGLGLRSRVLEIGPGLGSLTESLLANFVHVGAIELDRTFSEYWRSRDLELTEADALKLDWREADLTRDAKVLISNLPYQISASLVIDRCEDPINLQVMVLMFQKEVAQRITGRPQTGDYGFLSVMAQTFWNVELVLEAAPGEFYPAPQVASRVLAFRRKLDVEVDADHRSDFLKFVKAAFKQRRKYMVKNLLDGYFGGMKEKQPLIGEALVAINHTVQSRAEELSPSEFVKLYLALRRSV